jgi:hypothetical protein
MLFDKCCKKLGIKSNEDPDKGRSSCASELRKAPQSDEIA